MSDTVPPKMLMIDGEDEILKHWKQGTDALVIDRKQISSKIKDSPWPIDIPVSFRSMTKRKEIWKCWETGRPFYYIDNGYMGNLDKKKRWYRVVKNNIQHTKVPLFMGTETKWPIDRYQEICRIAPYMHYMGQKSNKQQNGSILLVTPSEKPCAFYNITRDDWVRDTIAELKKHTDRPIVIRDKGLRPDRIKNGSVASQCHRERIHSVVTYQSMAALEAIHFGIPAFTMAPCCVQSVANTDLSKIESPVYPDPDKFLNLLAYLAYCQFNLEEFSSGRAIRMIEEFKLYDH